MIKKMGLLLCALLLLLGFSACSSAEGALTALRQEVEAFPVFDFTAVGEIQFANPDTMPEGLQLRYGITGRRNRETSALDAMVHYTDEDGVSVFETHVLQSRNVRLLDFTPVLQHKIDQTYPEFTLPTVTEAFGADTYLIATNYIPSHIPVDLPSLIQMLERNEEFELDEGVFRFSLENDVLRAEVLEIVTAPFALLDYLFTLTREQHTSVMDVLQTGDLSEMHLELAVIFEEEGESFAAWITLEVPGFVTITADILVGKTSAWALTSPRNTITSDEFAEKYENYKAALARAIFLIESDITIIRNLPELQMVGHNLSTELLTVVDMEIGGQMFQVSVMENASNTQTPLGIYSFTSAMNILYTTVPAYFASETLALFVLDYLDTEDYDADEFFRTEMHINAQDTSAITALYFHDNLVGPALHIYVLESIEGTDYALLLRVIVLLDNLLNETIATLNVLGFYIGFDFQNLLIRALEDLQ